MDASLKTFENIIYEWCVFIAVFLDPYEVRGFYTFTVNVLTRRFRTHE